MSGPTRISGGISRIKPLGGRRSTTVSVLDVGSSKICCMIARVKPLGQRGRRKRRHAMGSGSASASPLPRGQVGRGRRS
jgi:cell division protein FtsA